jgi:hypothetical protein
MFDPFHAWPDTYFSALTVVAAPRQDCHRGVLSVVLDPLKHDRAAPNPLSIRNLLELKRKDML